MLPAMVLARMELISGRPVADLFDFAVGTSSGALTVLALTAPKQRAVGETSVLGVHHAPQLRHAFSRSPYIIDPLKSSLVRWKAEDIVNFYRRDSAAIFGDKAPFAVR